MRGAMTGFHSFGKFKYQAPDSLPGVLKILEKKPEAGKILAGGTDLIVQMRQGIVHPALVVDVKQVPELNRLEWDSKMGLRLGAAVPIRRLLNFKGLPKTYHVLIQACSLIGSWQIKNRATVGGNLCNAAPSADSAAALLCLEARVVLASPKASRILPLDEFFLGPGKTALADDEILVEIEVPPPPAHSAGYYQRHTTREEMDIAVAGVASFLTFSPEEGRIKSARISLGAVAPTPKRARGAEAVLTGKEIKSELIEQAVEMAASEAEPISDLRGSAEYRRELVRVLTRRTLMNAWKELGREVLHLG
jgi:CO/xanthine dehydrogenase FAD-binding subunit